MNWEMIGAIGEVAGAAAVVITLVYLAGQIRASAEATRQDAMQALLDQVIQFNSQLTKDKEIAALWEQGLRGEGSLDGPDLARLHSLFYQMTMLLARLYYLGQTGGLDPWLVTQTDRSRRDLVVAPGYQDWFRRRGHTFDEEFYAVVESEIAEGGRFEVYGKPEKPAE